LQELNIGDIHFGPLQEGKEYEVRFWIALELVKSGYSRFYDEDLMTFSDLNKIHWRETKLQSGRQISPLPEFFYPKLRRYLQDLKQKLSDDASFAGEYAQASRLAQDLVNCRLTKIVNLATYTHTENILKSLTKEEMTMFENMVNIVSEWKSKILKMDVLK